MSYLFRTPTVEVQLGTHRLFRRYRQPVAQTVLKRQDGSYVTVDFVSNEEAAAAAVAYVGGHEYVISNAEATALTTAGYGDYLTALDGTEPPVDPGDPGDPTDPPEYGAGAFGAGIYGS